MNYKDFKKTPVSRDIFGITKRQILRHLDRDENSSFQLMYTYFKELEEKKRTDSAIAPAPAQPSVSGNNSSGSQLGASGSQSDASGSQRGASGSQTGTSGSQSGATRDPSAPGSAPGSQSGVNQSPVGQSSGSQPNSQGSDRIEEIPNDPTADTHISDRLRQSTILQRLQRPVNQVKFPTPDFLRYKENPSNLFISKGIGKFSDSY